MIRSKLLLVKFDTSLNDYLIAILRMGDFSFLIAKDADAVEQNLQSYADIGVLVLYLDTLPLWDIDRIHAQYQDQDIAMLVLVEDQNRCRDKLEYVMNLGMDACLLLREVKYSVIVACIKHLVSKEVALSRLQTNYQHHQKAFSMLNQAEFHIRTLDEAYALAATLSGMLPAPERYEAGLIELLVNAVEHGNLGIDFALKAELLSQGWDAWEGEIQARLTQKDFKDKRVHVVWQRTEKGVHISIEDEGKGFDWQGFTQKEISPFSLNGRGIALAKQVSFDSLEYSNQGRKVCVDVYLPSYSPFLNSARAYQNSTLCAS